MVSSRLLGKGYEESRHGEHSMPASETKAETIPPERIDMKNIPASSSQSKPTSERPGPFLIKKEMADRVYAADISPRGKLVLTNLIHHYNARTGQCNPSLSLIAKETGYSDRTIRRILSKDLKGIVTWQRRQKSSQFTLFPGSDCPIRPDTRVLSEWTHVSYKLGKNKERTFFRTGRTKKTFF